MLFKVFLNVDVWINLFLKISCLESKVICCWNSSPLNQDKRAPQNFIVVELSITSEPYVKSQKGQFLKSYKIWNKNKLFPFPPWNPSFKPRNLETLKAQLIFSACQVNEKIIIVISISKKSQLTVFFGCPYETSNFGLVMKRRKPSKWVKVDRFQGLLHLWIWRTLNLENILKRLLHLFDVTDVLKKFWRSQNLK